MGRRGLGRPTTRPAAAPPGAPAGAADGAPAGAADGTPHPVECTVLGVFSGAAAGMIGAVFGLGMGLARPGVELTKKTGRLAVARLRSGQSAKSWGLLGGTYSGVACLARALRGREDPFNQAIGGCATGMVTGWEGGPVSALQNCATFGALSYFAEGLAPKEGGPANATEQEGCRALPFGKCPARTFRK